LPDALKRTSMGDEFPSSKLHRRMKIQAIISIYLA